MAVAFFSTASHRTSSRSLRSSLRIFRNIRTHDHPLSAPPPDGRIRLTPSDVGRTLDSIHDPDRALLFFDWASKQPHFRHDNITYSALVKILAQSHKFGKAWDVLESMKRSGIKPDDGDFNILIKCYCDAGKHSRAIHALETMPTFGVPPTSRTYHTLLSALVESEKHDLAMNVCKRMIVKFSEAGEMQNALCAFYQVKEKNLTPDIFTLNALINGFSKESNMKKSLELLSDMKDMGITPDVITHRHIIRGLCGLGKVDDAIAHLKEMKNDGCKPDITIYSVLMYCFCNLGRIDEGHKFLNDVLEEGNRVDSLVYSVLVSAYSKSGRMDEACVLCNEMLSTGYKPLESTESFLILGLCKVGKFEEARYFNDMMEESRSAKVPVGSLPMIKAVNFKDEVGQVLATMRSRGYTVSDSHPDDGSGKSFITGFNMLSMTEQQTVIASYIMLLKRLCDERRVDYAIQVFKEMLDHGFTPCSKAYNILITGANKISDAKRAVQLFREMRKNGLKPDAYICNGLVHNLCKAGETDVALEVFNEMKKYGDTPDHSFFTALISGLCKLNKVAEGCEIFMDMVKGGLEPSLSDVKALFPCDTEGQTDGKAVDVKHYLPLLVNIQGLGRKLDVCSIWDMLQKKGIFKWIS